MEISKVRLLRLAGLGLAVVMAFSAPQRAMAQDDSGASPVRPVTAMSTSVAIERVRSVMSDLDTGNKSGNYASLREHASPAFQDRYSADDLVRLFAPLRESKMDLRILRHLAPQFDELSALDSDGALRVAGTFRGGQRDVRFDMSFIQDGDGWRLDKIDVAAPETALSYVRSLASPAPSYPPPAGARAVTPATDPASQPAPVAARVTRIVPPVAARVINGEIQAKVRIEQRPMTQEAVGSRAKPASTVQTTRVSSGEPATDAEPSDVARNAWGVGLGPSVNAK